MPTLSEPCRCGLSHCTGCSAEASLAELLAMQAGTIPTRCVRVSSAQLTALEEHAAKGCGHRGEELRLAACPDCCGHVRVKVFSCALHGECTFVKQVLQIRTCATCPEAELEERLSERLTADGKSVSISRSSKRSTGTFPVIHQPDGA